MHITGSEITPRAQAVLWITWVVGALFLLDALSGAWYATVVIASALLLAQVPGALSRSNRHVDTDELAVMGGMYVGVVALLAVAFRVFTTDHVAGLFLSFAAALLLGVIGPIGYVVWRRGGSLVALGLRTDNWRETGLLALMFAGVQFALTLWGFGLPNYADWVPLLAMALVVGVFESIFFRGFLQTRLERQFGHVVGVLSAAALYGLYHVGYGMGPTEMVFLFGLGVVYAVAFAIPRNVFVLWPLLTPLGSFYNSVATGDIDLPWASILGFADVFAVMLAAMWLAHRHTKRRALVAVSA